ncbi:hypothetical protein [Microbacterium sp.]|uniref:hypothetical protein n=1 Tax=Microbacterium sp. TaxID=51671 RepID=UPI00289BF6D0|nr:hypothetical protein [Microbacterium sp.]
METTRRTIAIGTLATAAVLLVGCTSGGADAGGEGSPTPSPSASVTLTATPTPTPNPSVSAEAAELPIPPDEITEWAKTAVPGSKDEAYAAGFSGWMSASSAAHHTTDLTSMEPGSYQAQLACRGDGTITLIAGELTDEPGTPVTAAPGSAEPIACTNSTIAFDITTAETGMRIELDLDGAPTIYAVSVLRVS